MPPNSSRAQATPDHKKVSTSHAQFPKPPAFKKAPHPPRGALAEKSPNILAPPNSSQLAQKSRLAPSALTRQKKSPSIAQIPFSQAQPWRHEEDEPANIQSLPGSHVLGPGVNGNEDSDDEDSEPVVSRRSLRTSWKLQVNDDDEDSDDEDSDDEDSDDEDSEPVVSRRSLRTSWKLKVNDDDEDSDDEDSEPIATGDEEDIEEESDDEVYCDEAAMFHEDEVSDFEPHDRSDSSTLLSDSGLDDEDDLDSEEDSGDSEAIPIADFDLADDEDPDSESVDDGLSETELAELGPEDCVPDFQDDDFDFLEDDEADAATLSRVASNGTNDNPQVDLQGVIIEELFPPDRIDPTAYMDDISLAHKSVSEWRELYQQEISITERRYRAGIHEIKNIVMEQEPSAFFESLPDDQSIHAYWFRVFLNADPDILCDQGVQGVPTQTAVAYSKADFDFDDMKRLPHFDDGEDVVHAGGYWHFQAKKMSDGSYQLTTYNGMGGGRHGVLGGRINKYHKQFTRREYHQLPKDVRSYHYKRTCKEPGTRVMLDEYRASYVAFSTSATSPLCQLFEALDAAYLNSIVFEHEDMVRSFRISHATEACFRRVRNAMQEAVPDKPLPDFQKYASNRSWSLKEPLHAAVKLDRGRSSCCYKDCSEKAKVLVQQGNVFGPRVCLRHFHLSEKYLSRGPCSNCATPRDGRHFVGSGDSSICPACYRYRIRHGHPPPPSKWAVAENFASELAVEYLEFRRQDAPDHHICTNCADALETPDTEPTELCQPCSTYSHSFCHRGESRPPHMWSHLWDWVENVYLIDTEWSSLSEWMKQITRETDNLSRDLGQTFFPSEKEIENEYSRTGDTSKENRRRARARLKYEAQLKAKGRELTVGRRQESGARLDQECLRLFKDPKDEKERIRAAGRLSKRKAAQKDHPKIESGIKITEECLRLGKDPKDRNVRTIVSSKLRYEAKKASATKKGRGPKRNGSTKSASGDVNETDGGTPKPLKRRSKRGLVTRTAIDDAGSGHDDEGGGTMAETPFTFQPQVKRKGYVDLTESVDEEPKMSKKTRTGRS